MADEWTPKVGDRVRIIGVKYVSGEGKIVTGDADATGWYWVNAKDGDFVGTIHIRNLDRIPEDERQGLPRPPIQDGEKVNVVMTSTFRKVCSCNQRDVIHVSGGSFKADDPRVGQIERRIRNLGRQARK